jgi:uncharacterized membrane protein YgdD (TMEM256/DUF423 family)
MTAGGHAGFPLTLIAQIAYHCRMNAPVLPIERMDGRATLVCGTLLMALAVAAGAFGAHALRARLTPELLSIWQTAVTYHAWHALALIGVGLYRLHAPGGRGASVAALLFIAGIALFSGSLYALALTGVRMLGAITPLGGVAFIAGWLVWAWAVRDQETGIRGQKR